MNWIIVLGSGGFGVVIGIIVAWYLLDLRVTNLQALTSAVAIALGGVVLGFFKFLVGNAAAATEIWTYGIGLFFGFCGAMIVDWIIVGYSPKRLDWVKGPSATPPQSN
jgi:hypothetical protein